MIVLKSEHGVLNFCCETLRILVFMNPPLCCRIRVGFRLLTVWWLSLSNLFIGWYSKYYLHLIHTHTQHRHTHTHTHIVTHMLTHHIHTDKHNIVIHMLTHTTHTYTSHTPHRPQAHARTHTHTRHGMHFDPGPKAKKLRAALHWIKMPTGKRNFSLIITAIQSVNIILNKKKQSERHLCVRFHSM